MERAAVGRDDAVPRQRRADDRGRGDQFVRPALARDMAAAGLDCELVPRRLEGVPARKYPVGDGRGSVSGRLPFIADRRSGGVHARTA